MPKRFPPVTVSNIAATSIHYLTSWPTPVMSTIAFTTYDNFLTAELEDLLEYAKPINAVNDSPTGNIVKVGEDVLGSA